MNIKPYKKFIVAILVPVVGILLKKFGLDIEFGEEQATSLMNILIPVLTAMGVFGVANET